MGSHETNFWGNWEKVIYRNCKKKIESSINIFPLMYLHKLIWAGKIDRLEKSRYVNSEGIFFAVKFIAEIKKIKKLCLKSICYWRKTFPTKILLLDLNRIWPISNIKNI